MKSKKYSDALLNLFKKKGFKVKEFENIIESKIIIERSGEIFKKSLLSFEDDNGKNFSLRPDLTINHLDVYRLNKTSYFRNVLVIKLLRLQNSWLHFLL